MKIAITGSTGLVGEALVKYFEEKGNEVIRIVRPSTKIDKSNCVVWNIKENIIDSKALEGVDVVINLAGASVAGKRWTQEYKKEIYDSRVKGTTLLSNSLANLEKPPKVLISASATGYYGPCDPKAQITEHSIQGTDFLSQVCEKWEKATKIAGDAGIRVVNTRIGVVLSKNDGAIAKMMTPFKLGLGGKLGSGLQVMSWIALEEMPTMFEHCINKESLSGSVNFVAPNPVSNIEFTKVFGKAIKRPTILPAPSFAIKLLLGEMGDALLLSGAQVLPKKLLESGYQFRYPTIDKGLNVALNVAA